MQRLVLTAEASCRALSASARALWGIRLSILILGPAVDDGEPFGP